MKGLKLTGGDREYVPGHGDPTFAVRHYELDLEYTPIGNRLVGTATLTVEALEEITALRLYLVGLSVDKVTVGGKQVRYSHRLSHLRITLAKPLAAGKTAAVRVKYSGKPKPHRKRHLGAAGWEELEDGVLVAAQPHGAPTWYPCNDRPSDKATYRLTITAPNDYLVAFSGEQTSRRRGGSATTWVFEPSGNSSRNAAIGIAAFTVIMSCRIILPTVRSRIQPISAALRMVSPRRCSRQVANE